MSIPNQEFPENSLKFRKHRGYSPQKGNEISFWAFLFSLFIYISIFYIFNLSPSSVLNTTKFWFFLSNTLILIIAADFSAFSLSRKQQDRYNEYVKTSRKDNLAIIGSQYREIVNTATPLGKVETSQESREEIKEVVRVDGRETKPVESSQESREEIKEVVRVDGRETKPVENNLHIILKNDSRKTSENCLEDVPRPSQKIDDFESRSKNKNEVKIVRTMSELSTPVKDSEDKTILSKTESEKYDKKVEGDEEDSEFSTMSNEELNQRAEEFIRKFNRQIRLQAIRNRTQQI